MDVEYVFQSIDDLPEGFYQKDVQNHGERAKLFLCCKDVVKDPFVVINADGLYGKEAFKLLHDFLAKPHSQVIDLT